MSSSEKKRRRTTMVLDRLSALPNDVTQKILSCLPIEDAVRTSVLSTRWKLRWTMLPRIVFDADFYEGRSQRRGPILSTAEIVDHILFVHFGSIETFSLTMRQDNHFEFGKWILYLSRNSIKELELKMREHYTISSHLFSCKDLTHLELWNCSLVRPPSTFKGFRMLKSLNLERVYVCRVLENMIACSPLLERMALRHLKYCKDDITYTSLQIDAPNLQVLELEGEFEDLQLINTMNLVDVSVDLYKRGASRASRKLLESFIKLPRMQRLSLEGLFLHCAAVGFLPEEQFTPCLHLKFLSLPVCVDNVEEILTAICLLRSSPALQELEISVRQNYEAVDTNWLSDNQDCKFVQLRRLKVTGFSGLSEENAFVKFLYLSSPALQELEISYENVDVQLEGRRFWLDDSKNCSQLRFLKISNFSRASLKEFVKFLLLTSPALEKLEISFNTNERENRRLRSIKDRVVGEDVYSYGTFTQLRVIELNGFSGIKDESFIRFLFTSSPVIERATLQPASGNVSWEVTKLLAELKSVSSYTDFKFLEPLS